MSLLSPGFYDELMKWRWGVATWRSRFKIILGIFILGTAYSLFSKLTIIPHLEKENALLNKHIQERDVEIASLRHENQKLYANNLHLQEMTAPFVRKAQEAYPELELAAAMVKLSKDLDDVRQLAERDVFRPFSQDLRHKVANNLKSISGTYPTLQLKVIIRGREGDTNRQLFAGELLKLFQSAGIPAEIGPFSTPFGMQEPLTLYYNPESQALAEAFMNALAPVFISTPIRSQKRDSQRLGELELYLNGTPEFGSDGSARLR